MSLQKPVFVLKQDQRDATERASVWKEVSECIGVKSTSPLHDDLASNLSNANCVITHRDEYQLLSAPLDKETPVIVFSGGSTMEKDENRPKTYWMPFGVLSNGIPKQLRSLFAILKSGSKSREEISAIIEKDFFDIPRLIEELSPYKLLQEEPPRNLKAKAMSLYLGHNYDLIELARRYL